MKAQKLIELAQAVAKSHENFFVKKGPGIGDRCTSEFMKKLRKEANSEFGEDHAEKSICGKNRFTVDYYFPVEKTVVEVALSLRNSSSEFERDIIKVLLARVAGNEVERLIFISKPGAKARLNEPAPQAIMKWAKEAQGLALEIFELN